MRRWQLQEAKTRFSELVRQAEGGEVWLVTKHGVLRVVVIDVATYGRLTVPERRVVSTSGFLLDTNVVSEALRPRPDARVLAWLRAWLDEVLIPQFTHRLLSVDLAVARRWGERTAAARANGTPIGAVDALSPPPRLGTAWRWRRALCATSSTSRSRSSTLGWWPDPGEGRPRPRSGHAVRAAADPVAVEVLAAVAHEHVRGRVVERGLRGPSSVRGTMTSIDFR